MTEQEFWITVNQTFMLHIVDAKQGNAWRWGQTCMNVLYEVMPGLHDMIAGTIADPWNKDVNSHAQVLFNKIISEQQWAK